MRSPFSFISSRVRVVMLVMLTIQLGDFALPEIAVGQLGMWNRQIRFSHDARYIAYDVEIQRARSPALAAFSTPLRLDRPAICQELGRAETRFEQHHLVQIRRLRNRTQRRRLVDSRRRDQARL